MSVRWKTVHTRQSDNEPINEEYHHVKRVELQKIVISEAQRVILFRRKGTVKKACHMIKFLSALLIDFVLVKYADLFWPEVTCAETGLI